MSAETPRTVESEAETLASGQAIEPLSMIPERIISRACPEIRDWTIDRIYSDPESAVAALECLIVPFDPGPDRAAIQYALATAMAVIGDLDRAEDLLEQAIGFYRSRNDELSAAHVLLRWNLVWHQRGQFDHAIREFAGVVEVAREYGDHWLECATLSDTAMVQMLKGSVADGIANIIASLTIADRGDDDTLRSIIRMNFAGALYDLHDYAAAAGAVREVLANPPAARRLPVLFDGTRLLAACLEELGDVDQALENLKTAQRYATELVFPFGLAESAYDEGRQLYRLGHADEAIDSFRRASKTFESLEGPNSEARVAIAEWWCELIEQRFTQSTLDRLVQAAGDAPGDAYSRTFDLHDAISQSAIALGHLELAIAHLQESRRLVEAYWSELGDRQARAAHARFQLDTMRETAEHERALRQQLAGALNEAEGLNRTNQALLKQLRLQSATLERQAIEDTLTQIGNRRHFIARLENELARSREFHHPVTVAFADIDDFKAINDLYTHRTGDNVLRDIAQLLASNIRAVDTVARYGGEEFAFILPEADQAIATAQLERVRSAVEAHIWSVAGVEIRVTISIGVARNEATASVEELVAKADELLYQAKRAGKNRVVFKDFNTIVKPAAL